MRTLSTFSKFRGITSLLLLLAISPSLAGCPVLLVGAAGGVAGTVYVMGKLQAEMDAPVPQVRRAALAGLKSLDLPVTKDEGDKLAARLESKTADDKQIWVSVDSISESRSKLSIRVGIVGDEARSRRILDAIKANL